MIHLLTFIENIIISIGILVVFLILIPVFIKLIIKQRKSYLKSKALSINDVVRIKQLMKLIEYRINQKQKKQEEVYFSLLLVSIDQFDQLNKYVSAPLITVYLKNVAKLLRANLIKGAKLAQTKERERFLIYLPEIYDEATFYHVASKFKSLVERKVIIKGDITVQKTVSIAMTAFPAAGTDVNMLLKNLKTTMYYIKRQNGNMIAAYTSELKTQYPERYDMFKQAIKNQEFKMFFYPFYDPKSLEIYGTEVIMNWSKSEEVKTLRDLVYYAETSGDEYWLGVYMFEQTIEAHSNLFRVMGNKEYYAVIQTSIRQFEYEGIVSAFQRIVQRYQVNPRRVYLQIINPIEANSSIRLMKNILDLQNLGFKFILEANKIDDRLMVMLNEYKVSAIKISKEILNSNIAGLKELMHFIENNNVTIIATNVENTTQAKELISSDISFVQGPYDDFPCTKEDLLTIVTKHRQTLEYERKK